MKMIALGFGIMVSMTALATELERYLEFQKEGVLDPALPNGVANAIVRAGIESGEPDVVNATIAALGAYAGAQVSREYGVVQLKPLARRAFSEVSGLKEFLIGFWRERHEASGYDAFGTPVDEVMAMATDADGLEAALNLVTTTLAWQMIPNILCTIYPGDVVVHDLLWEIHATETTPFRHTLHGLLNRGQFTTPEATAYRLNELRDPDGGGGEETRHVAVSVVARGLALSSPPEALPALIAAGLRYPVARDDVLKAIATYGDAELKAQAGDLTRLLAVSAAGGDDRTNAARQRLRAFATEQGIGRSAMP